jgi:hypothetical protein
LHATQDRPEKLLKTLTGLIFKLFHENFLKIPKLANTHENPNYNISNGSKEYF